MDKAKRNYTMPIIVCFFLFAMISFVTGFQNPFGVILKGQLSLSNLQSQLGNLANFAAYLFMGLPAGLVLRKKGFKYSALCAVVLGLIGVAMMFASSMIGQEAKDTIFTVYLIGAFVAGFSMCMLNTVVNPLLNTLGGGGRAGNQLLQFGGATNSLAATICPVLVGYLMGDNLKECTLIQARPALWIALGIFALAFIVLSLSRLPEPILEEQKRAAAKGNAEAAKAPSLRGAFRFSHFVWGVIGIFLYVGIEVGIPNFANLYMTTDSMEMAQKKIADYEAQQRPSSLEIAAVSAEQGVDAMDAAAQDAQLIPEEEYVKAKKIVSGESQYGLGMSAAVGGTLVGMYWFLMLVGRLIGGVVGAKVSSRAMLAFTSSLAVVFLLCAICFDGSVTVAMPGINSNLEFAMADVSITVLFLILCGLCTSVMWGGIFNLAVEGLGKYTAVASGFFMVMVCGGGILPLLQGLVADMSGYLASYWVLIAAVVFLLFYALVGSRVHRVDSDAKEITPN